MLTVNDIGVTIAAVQELCLPLLSVYGYVYG